MKVVIVLAVLLGGSWAGLVKRAAQSPGVWSALDQLRGKARLSIEDIRALLVDGKPGEDYPNLTSIPEADFDCTSVNQPGFYADVGTKCQVVHRCDVNGNHTAYLCPVLTVFNQITLVCHWFWDVDCSKAKDFYDYSNSRLYLGADIPLLDNEDSYVVVADAGASEAAAAAPKAKSKSKGKKKAKKAEA